MEKGRPRPKISKAESLKPVGKYLASLLTEHGLSSSKTKLVVTDMLDRLLTAGYGWDKMILYHAKVSMDSSHYTHIVIAQGGRQVLQETHSLHLHV